METLTVKSLDDNFTDWESNAFGFGYGSGEEYIIPALKTFFAAIGRDDSAHGYDYQKLEAAVDPLPAWLLINVMCRVDIFEYGTSPRYGWLTPHGERLKAFIDSKTADELAQLTCRDEDYTPCYPNACNCGPRGYEKGRKCNNAFWK